MAIRIGSWGLPELGITESLSGLLSGGSRTAQGGSNLLGGGLPTAQTNQGVMQGPGLGWGGSSDVYRPNVLGASTSAYNPNANMSPFTGGQSTNTTLSGGGGGGGGGSSNPSGTNLEQNAQGSADAELSTLNSAFDYNKSLLEDQSRDLDSQWNTTDKFYTDQQSRLTGTVDNSKVEAQNTAEENKADALRTAQDVKKQNRMMLRALGVLNSTSATELLAKPMGEYERVRATVAKNLTGRLNELNDFLDSKVSELTFAATQNRQQYESLKGKIATDLRFNERSRADAIKSATAALEERLAEIRLTLQGYTNQVASDQSKIAEYVQTLQSEGLGTVGTEGITNTALSTPTANMSPLTAAIYQPEEKRRLTDVYA